MVLGGVVEYLPLGLQSVHLQLDLEVLRQLGQLDHVREDKGIPAQSLQGGHHLRGYDLAGALHQTKEVVHEVVRLPRPQLVNKLLYRSHKMS